MYFRSLHLPSLHVLGSLLSIFHIRYYRYDIYYRGVYCSNEHIALTDKVYWYEQRSGMRRKVAKILDMLAAEIDPHIKEKGVRHNYTIWNYPISGATYALPFPTPLSQYLYLIEYFIDFMVFIIFHIRNFNRIPLLLSFV